MATQIQVIQVYEYGDANQLKLEQIAQPEPKEGEVLVRVHAAGVNPVDWKIRSGAARHYRQMSFPYTPGADFAGTLEKVGDGVTAFQVGQDVFGHSSQGTYTQYTVAPVNDIAVKPKSLSFEEAATIPIGATTAWQGLFDHGNLRQGQRVLILGGSGGVGLFAVQFAHRKGAQVISTTSTRNVDFVRSLGAQTVIDYTQTQVEEVVHDVDLVFDTVGGETLATAYSLLKRGGTLVTIAGQPDEAKANQAKATQFGIHVDRFSAQSTGEQLAQFAKLFDEGQVKPFVGELFPLNEAAHAQEFCQQGHGRGRIVLQIA